ncbi:uncharacterized protein B0I36DRAFT_77770 [Microdochium trichocladiopsis]|uniref:Uncharacterized protein n=1 Tax=Microdochium trichocladiopsis TaxID=1682393 RepID=A0A9P8YG02_9PEZI|nr:uncharacterized protein B0I36DRAFT_77770 [Microdochium trichocladiopsis]KAH7038286.1 hypothetical protein B0I36DRAFT_77770 [Microdochium trichocladiopsis]
MRSSQLIALSGFMVATAAAESQANIGFAMVSDSCGDGFYIGCSVNVGECCTLPDGYKGLAAEFRFSQDTSVVGKAYTGPDCVEADLVVKQDNNSTYFCIAKPSAPLSSAHYELSSTAGRKAKRGGARAKACRSPDHLIFPGGARANIDDLAPREYKEMTGHGRGSQ